MAIVMELLSQLLHDLCLHFLNSAAVLYTLLATRADLNMRININHNLNYNP